MKNHTRIPYVPEARPGVGSRRPFTRLLALAGLLVFTALPALPGAALRASVTAQSAPPILNT